jgi:hypothetical protein
MAEATKVPAVAAHGADCLSSVEMDSYNVELKDNEGFIGDRASKGAFRDMIERRVTTRSGTKTARSSAKPNSMNCWREASQKRLALSRARSKSFHRSLHSLSAVSSS